MRFNVRTVDNGGILVVNYGISNTIVLEIP